MKYQCLQMNIRDYGPRVDSVEMAHLTSKSFRESGEAVALQEGSGLGLHISKTLIEKMDGEIRCDKHIELFH